MNKHLYLKSIIMCGMYVWCIKGTEAPLLQWKVENLNNKHSQVMVCTVPGNDVTYRFTFNNNPKDHEQLPNFLRINQPCYYNNKATCIKKPLFFSCMFEAYGQDKKDYYIRNLMYGKSADRRQSLLRLSSVNDKKQDIDLGCVTIWRDFNFGYIYPHIIGDDSINFFKDSLQDHTTELSACGQKVVLSVFLSLIKKADILYNIRTDFYNKPCLDDNLEDSYKPIEYKIKELNPSLPMIPDHVIDAIGQCLSLKYYQSSNADEISDYEYLIDAFKTKNVNEFKSKQSERLKTKLNLQQKQLWIKKLSALFVILCGGYTVFTYRESLFHAKWIRNIFK